MLDGYIPLLITLILIVVGLIATFSVLPSIAESRYKKDRKISLKPKDIISNLLIERNPPAKDGSYLQTYESGEVAKGDIGKFVTVQYYVIMLLFILFDVDMVLLFPWAMNFKALGIGPFIETLIFLAMPLFVVYYAFREGYMRWMK